jgi:serine/threonine protein kinase
MRKPNNKSTIQIIRTVNTTRSQELPFTKLSSFRFRKELGRGAFGRVLLAEAKTDGKLYALKIISKKNMRSSDRRQAKAERDILYCMTLKAPHPFTSGLKFAF